jgi:branched-chain amino acid transport system substrate-binding protein
MHGSTRRSRTLLAGLVAASAVAVAVAGCGSSGSSSTSGGASTGGASTGGSSGSGPIKFGYVNALTGPYAVAGLPELNAVKLAVKKINATGGVCKRQLQLAATADDQGQANLSIAGLRKLVQQDGLQLVIGPGITPPGLATAPVAERLKTWFMLETAQSAPWTNKTYVFSSITPQDVEGQLVFDWMKKKLGSGPHKVAIVYAAVPYAQAGYTQLNQLAKQAGWTVVDSDSYDPSALTFQTQASKVASANPEGLMFWGAATPADAQVLKQVRAAGYKGPAVGDVAFSLPFIPKDAGAAADTITTLSQLNTINPPPETQKFLEEFQAAYNQQATYLPGAAYDAVHILAAAIQKAGCKTDSLPVSQAMVGLNYTGVNGPYAYTATYKGGPPANSFKYITYKDGKAVFAE